VPTSNIKVKLSDKASAGFKKLGKNVGGVTKKLTMMSNKMALTRQKFEGIGKSGKSIAGAGRRITMGLGAPLALLGASAIRAGLNFDKAMNEVEAKAEVAGKSILDLRNQAKELGATTKFSASQAASAMVEMAKAGNDTQKIYDSMPAILSLAAASNMDIGETADIATNIMGAFKLEAKDMTRVADVMASTMASSNVDMSNLSETMKVAAPVAAKYGLTIESMSAATGLLGNIGIKGSMAGTTLRAMFINMATMTPKVKKGLRGMGVEITDSNGNLLDFTKVLQNLGKALPHLDQASRIKVLKDIFGKRAIAGASELTDMATNGKLQKFIKKLGKVEGAAKTMADTMEQGAVGAVTKMKSAFEGAQIAIAESGLLDSFAKFAVEAANMFASISRTNPAILKWGVIIAGAAVAFGPLLVALGSLMIMLPTIIGAFSALGLTTGLTLGPIILALAGIALGMASVGRAIFVMLTNWDGVKLSFLSIIDTIGDAFDDMILGIQDSIPDFIVKFAGIELDTDKKRKELEKKRKERDLRRAFEISASMGTTASGATRESLTQGFTKTLKEKREHREKLATFGPQNSKVDVVFKNAPLGLRANADDKNTNVSFSNVGFLGGGL